MEPNLEDLEIRRVELVASIAEADAHAAELHEAVCVLECSPEEQRESSWYQGWCQAKQAVKDATDRADKLRAGLECFKALAQAQRARLGAEHALTVARIEVREVKARIASRQAPPHNEFV